VSDAHGKRKSFTAEILLLLVLFSLDKLVILSRARQIVLVVKPVCVCGPKSLDKCELVHPIVYESFNLCNTDAPKDYKKLTIAMLRSMCEYFELDVSTISATRKGPYIDLLTSLVQECSFASLCPQKC